MRRMKQFLSLAVLLIVFVIGTSILLKQYRVCKRAYQELGKNISHSTIELETDIEDEVQE